MISKFVRFADTTIILYSFFFIIFYFSGGAHKNMIYKYFYIAAAPRMSPFRDALIYYAYPAPENCTNHKKITQGT